MITVLVVDDHAMVRAGLVTLLESGGDVRVVGQAADGAAAVLLARQTTPDVVLMDLSMPGVDGVEATAAVVEAVPATKVVVLTSFSDQRRVAAALDAGAVGYQLKDADPEELLAAVRAAQAGHAPLDARVARFLLPRRTRQAADGLTGREREVLRLVADGLANKQVARALGISERTVKAHLGRVFRQLGVLDRTSAALWARDHLDADA